MVTMVAASATAAGAITIVSIPLIVRLALIHMHIPVITTHGV